MFVRFESVVAGGGPVGPAGGDLSGFYPDPNVRGFHETTGPTQLLYGSVPDLTYLKRSGLTVVGTDPNVDVKGPWSSVLYVDNVRGSDTTGTRGNENRPFATIQAAFNAMLTDDFVTLAPQTFLLTVALTVPASVVRFGCSGALPILASASFTGSTGSTIRQSTGATSCINLGANLGLNRCILSNIAFLPGAGAGTPAIVADGSAYAVTSYLVGGLTISSCENLSITALYAFGVSIFESTGSSQCPFTFTGCFGANFTRTNALGSSVLFAYDIADVHVNPAFGPGSLSLRQNTIIGSTVTGSKVVLTGQPTLRVDQTSTTGGVTASGLTVSGTAAPSVSHCGYFGHTAGGIGIDFASAGAELPDTALVVLMDFRGARLYSTTVNTPPTPSVFGIVTAQFKIAGAAANAQSVAMDSTIALPGTQFIARANVNITGRGAIWPQPVFSTPDASGSITPPRLAGLIDTNGLAAAAKTWVQLGIAGLVRTGAAPDEAYLTSRAQGCDAVITAYATTGLSLTGNAVANNASWLAIWN